MANGGAKEHPVMEIRITGLPDGDQTFSFEADASEIDLPRFRGPVTVSGTLRKVSTQFFVQGTSRGTLIGECDRCLAEVHRAVEAPLNLFYQVSPDARSAARTAPDEDAADVQSIHPEQDVIVLDAEVRQSLMLEVPLKVLCRDDCAGLCPGCGANLNTEQCRCEEPPIDPRWAKLADLYKNTEEN
ncbi:MAG TPA: DUF177 domain-containing protein [Candidatus Kapabacteria bacterium]|jgi:uncharacterized protein|nr:DUF177 domain-containing protein [Candidatus Kapabacteria bacterium]